MGSRRLTMPCLLWGVCLDIQCELMQVLVQPYLSYVPCQNENNGYLDDVLNAPSFPAAERFHSKSRTCVVGIASGLHLARDLCSVEVLVVLLVCMSAWGRRRQARDTQSR